MTGEYGPGSDRGRAIRGDPMDGTALNGAATSKWRGLIGVP